MINHDQVIIKNTKQQWILLFILCIVQFLGAMIYSIQGPFYPAQAESKMVTPSEYGFVLGTFGLTQLILGPIFGTHLRTVGVKNAFHGGIVIAAVSTMMFGLLKFIENRYAFMVLSFLLEILEGSGALAMSVSMYIFIVTDFPGSIGKTFATVETVYSLGMSLGPSVGVMLFYVGGFILPFVALGFIYLLVGGLTYLVLPKSSQQLEQVQSLKEQQESNKKPFGFITLLKAPSVTMYACSIISAILTSQFMLGSILEPHLRKFNLSSTMFCLIFFLNGFTQAIFFNIWGYICDRISKPEFITLLGSAFLTISSFSIGPFVYLPMESNLAMTAVSLVGIGLGTSAILVSGFLLILREAANYGFPVNENTSCLVSGLFMSSISFGSFSGPLVAGILYQHYGIRVATTVLTFLNLIMSLTLGIVVFTKIYIAKRTKGQTRNETIILR